MLLSFKWLEQYLPKGLKVSNEKLRNRLTISLTEVEGFEYIGEKLDKIVVGQIKEIKKHPKSERLKIVIVDVGTTRKRTIVCAADNIFEGANVPVALPGGKVLNPEQKLGSQEVLEISEVEIKKVKSSGMLASQKELGISDDNKGIWILPDELGVGENFKEIISDTILDIENKALTHRPDCFSHLGIAREISAILKIPFDYHESDEALVPTKTLPLVVKVENKELCKRYTAVAIQGVEIGPSPLWMQLRLLACGIKPVNNVVDSTNYVMLDIGQPIHAFDYNKLESPRITVRTAKSGEKITTLDGQERELKKDHLLITDPSGAIAIGGVMGGVESEVDETTTDIIIESANFEMFSTRKTSMSLGLRTEASKRFEKGLDPNMTLPALRRVVELITELAGGEVATDLIDIYPKKEEETTIDFEVADVNKLLGIEISREEIIESLVALRLEVNSPENSVSKITVTVPTFRQDLSIKEDLIEEVARMYSYDRFKATLPTKSLAAANKNIKREYEKNIKKSLSALGFDEVYSYAFIGEQEYKDTQLSVENNLKIINPLAPELKYLRDSLVPSILKSLKVNIANFDSIQIFELARIYLKEKNEEDLPDQPKHIACLVAEDEKEKDLYFKLKGKLEALLKNSNVENIKFKISKDIPYLAEKVQASIFIQDMQIGHIGILKPKVKNNWDLNKNVALCQLDMEKIYEAKKEEVDYTPVSRYPYVKRDLSFWINRKKSAQEILDEVKKVETSYIIETDVKDIYFDTKCEERKSITLQITLQAKGKTLTEDEINKDIDSIIKNVEKTGGKLRKG